MILVAMKFSKKNYQARKLNEISFVCDLWLGRLKTAISWGRKGGRPKVNQQKVNQSIALYHSERMSVKEIQEATVISSAFYIEC